MKAKTLLYVAAGACAIFLIGKFLYGFLPRPTVASSLNDAAQALASDDARTLLALTDPQEVKALSLDAEKLGALLAWRRQLLGAGEIPGKPSLVTDDVGSVGFVEVYNRIGSKDVYTSFGAYKAEEGARVNVVGDLVVYTLYNAYTDKFPKLGKLESKWPAVSLGLEENMNKLKAIGIDRYFTGPQEFTTKTWDELKAASDRRANKILADAAAQH